MVIFKTNGLNPSEFMQRRQVAHSGPMRQPMLCRPAGAPRLAPAGAGSVAPLVLCRRPAGLLHSRSKPARLAALVASPKTVNSATPQPSQPAVNVLTAARDSVRGQFAKLDGMWGRFLPMSVLFFLMAFVNTILDSLKDSLVITAVGGGTEVLPYLSVYAVLPSSLLFLVAYAWGTQRFSRERLFNVIICSFLAFYAAFGLAYPHHEALHLSGWADSLEGLLPSGLNGLIGMMRNWLFTAFYCLSELWGDVVLSLLFWGLANETTSIEDAPLLYPLFGVGANIAQTLAGRALRVFSDGAGVGSAYSARLQATIALCVGLGLAVVALHRHISKTFPKNPKGSTALRLAAERGAAEAAQRAADDELRLRHVKLDLEASVHGLNYCDVEDHSRATMPSCDAITTTTTTTATTSSSSSSSSSPTGSSTSSMSSVNGSGPDPPKPPPKAPKATMTLSGAFAFLRRSPQIRCLAVMALAQGITTRLLEISWKYYLHQMYTTPAAYAAFLGDTAMWTGIVTGSLMFTSPALFDRIGWRGVASVTPSLMLWGGVPFFLLGIAYNSMAGGALTAAGAATLQALVLGGAALQIFSRGAKFSLFKPAEEMVYIGLDDESRTKGKAAIDVVGAQSGKSVTSILQQTLLIITSGTIGGILPVLAVFFAAMLHRWSTAVADLAEHYDPAHVHRLSVMGSMDESSDAEDANGSGNGSGSGSGEGSGIIPPRLPTPATA